MKRGTDLKFKFRLLKARLRISTWEIKGVLQALWDFTAENAPLGDVGRYSDEEIALGIEWPPERAYELVSALVDTRWLDRSDAHRLVVHDWHDHCEEWLRKRVTRAGETFASMDVVFTTPLSDNGRQASDARLPSGSPPGPILAKPEPCAAAADGHRSDRSAPEGNLFPPEPIRPPQENRPTAPEPPVAPRVSADTVLCLDTPGQAKKRKPKAADEAARIFREEFRRARGVDAAIRSRDERSLGEMLGPIGPERFRSALVEFFQLDDPFVRKLGYSPTAFGTQFTACDARAQKRAANAEHEAANRAAAEAVAMTPEQRARVTAIFGGQSHA